MATGDKENIQEHGKYNYRELQNINNNRLGALPEDPPTINMSGWKLFSAIPTKQLSSIYRGLYEEPIGLRAAEGGYGKSVYDEGAVSNWQLSHLNEVRAVAQPGLLLLGNGLIKFGTTAATTFLNSTLGLLYGVGTGVFNELGLNGENEEAGGKKSKKTFLQGLWDNDFNRAMAAIQEGMEEIAPNYYTEAYANSPWYTNILSANFIGDKVLKNMGFTAGVLLAMAATGGIGIAGFAGKAALLTAKATIGGVGKVLGASRGTLATINSIARGIGLLAHHAVQGAIGAAGEASIEAINTVQEAGKIAYLNLENRIVQLKADLDPYDPMYQLNLEAIDSAAEEYKKEVDSKLRDAGNSVFKLNMAILAATNALEFGSIVKGGFKRSMKLRDFETKLDGKSVDLNTWASGLLRGEKATIENTVDTSWKTIAGRNLMRAASEGFEEAAQNLASNTEKLYALARLNDYAEDSLLGARINPEVTSDLLDYSKAFSKAWSDNFGSPESPGWEEFFLGALTGGIGSIGLAPHAVTNEKGEQMYDPKTHEPLTSWKPRTITDLFQGGIAESIRETRKKYRDNQILVDAINDKLSSKEFVLRLQHAVATKNYTDLMNEALLENDIFKFKNSEIGKLVEDVLFFRDKGMIDLYKAIFEGMERIDDKTLQLLYSATVNQDGDTELSKEDLEEVRNDYQEKAKSNLDKIKVIQDYYDYIDEEYRERSPLFKEELTYQYIRLDDTRRRIAELKKKGNTPNRVISTVLGALDKISDEDESRKEWYENRHPDNLSEQEKEDLKRLERQEAKYNRKIKNIRKKPELVDFMMHAEYYKAKEAFDKKDIEALTKRLLEAESILEVDLILGFADESIRLEIINKIYLEGSPEIKEKLQQQIITSNAYNASISRLKKLGFSQENAESYTELLNSLIYNIYISNKLDFNEAKKTLDLIISDLNENSLDTISQLMPDNYQNFEVFLNGENQNEKDILLDYLEGAREDIANGIMASSRWRTEQKIRTKEATQKKKNAEKQLLKLVKAQLKKESFELAVDKSKHIKNIKNIKSVLETTLESLQKFGIDNLDSIIETVIKENNLDTNDKDDYIGKLLRLISTIFNSNDPLSKIAELKSAAEKKKLKYVLDALEAIEKKYKETFTSITKKAANKDDDDANSLVEKLKEAVEKEDKEKIQEILAALRKISNPLKGLIFEGVSDEDAKFVVDTAAKYKTTDTQHKDGEITSETTEKDGVKTTKFYWWRNGKAANNGGQPIEADSIDKESLDTDNIEKVVLTELIEKEGKFSGHIVYSVKGEKGRKEADVSFRENPIKEKADNTQTVDEIPDIELTLEEPFTALENTELQKLFNAYCSKYDLDTNSLSEEDLVLIIDNLKKAIDVVNSKKEYPKNLESFIEVVLDEATKDKETPIKEVKETPSIGATADNELNGIFTGLYDVGNKSEGRENPLAKMEAKQGNKKSLEYFYETIENAEAVQWCVDNILSYIKAKGISILFAVNTIKRNSLDSNKPTVIYPVVRATKELIDKAKGHAWIITALNEEEYIVIGSLGFTAGNNSQLNLWEEIGANTLEQADTESYEGYWLNTDTKYEFKVNNIGEGRPAKSHYSHASTISIVELIEDSDKGRNPHKLKLRDVKWEIIGLNSLVSRTVNVNSSDRIIGSAKISDGKVYVLIPTPSGTYYRHPIKPITAKEINKDSELYNNIEGLINKIVKNKDINSIIALKTYLVLEDTKLEHSLLYITIEDDESITVKYRPREGMLTKVTLSPDANIAIEELEDIIYNKIDPLVSISIRTLTSLNSIRQLDEAGALQLKEKLAIFGYVGANYTLVPASATVNSKPGNRVRSTLEDNTTTIIFNKETIYYNVLEQSFYKNNKKITDRRTIETLLDILLIYELEGEKLWKLSYKGKGNNRKSYKKYLEGEYYFVKKGNDTLVYHKDIHNNVTKISGKKAKTILSIRETDTKNNIPDIKETIADTTIEEAANPEEVKAGKGTDLNIEEGNNANRNTLLIKNKKETNTFIEERKQASVKKAILALEQQKELKVGDTITDSNTNAEASIKSITFSDATTEKDDYSYDDITGTVVATVIDTKTEEEYDIPISLLISGNNYKKSTLTIKKSVNNLDNSQESGNFVDRLLDTSLPDFFSDLINLLLNKAAEVANERGIKFDSNCTVKELLKWYEDNLSNLRALAYPTDIENAEAIINDMIKNCK